ncbi:hypothetical protein TREES_T100014361 [Tupaia chinensis]|uniref:Uncharacterized protein n=1 Tax=Tupaia chinensis TaxID=246437 RepID=L9JDE5_TUPCH|nr:hypothetical protein TREES_T100014361 [Tupaia chinensis]
MECVLDWGSCSILKSAVILQEPVILRAQTCPAGSRPLNEQELPRTDPPAWLLRACLTGQRMRSHSIGIEELAQGRTPPHHVDLARRLRAEKSIEQIEQLFMKIDYEAVGRIRWDSVCTYLQLEYLEQANALARQKEASFLLPAVLQRLSYGGPVLRILSMPDDTLIMIREDGAIYFWSLQLKLKRKKRIFDKSMHQKARWVTDMVSMPQYNKLIVATGNREIQLYELSNLEPYCQIGGLEAVPLKLDYCSVDPDNCLILYGDDQLIRYNVIQQADVHRESPCLELAVIQPKPSFLEASRLPCRTLSG